MWTRNKGLGIIFATLLLNLFAICLPIFSEDAYESIETQQHEAPQWNGYQPCGPDCTCGCATGGPCTCYNQFYQSNQNDASYSQYSPYVEGKSSYNQYGQYSQEQSSYNQYYQYSAGDGSYNQYYQCDQDDSCCEKCYKPILQVDPVLDTIEWCADGGVWLPEDPVLFRPFMADPREIDYSVGWRFNDNVLTKNVIDVSFGDTLGIYRWCNVWPWCGELQIEVEGALWAVFDPLHHSAPLMNADYYVGFPLTYAIDRWQFRLRAYHISCHIGDEFLLNHPGFDRRNASAEYLDFFVSHDLTDEIRIYGGVGCFLRQDEEFKCKPFYSAVGAELRLLGLGFLNKDDLLYGCPIFAMHFRQNGEFKKHIDATYILGYEFGKLCGLYRKVRFFAEYHDGYSVEGQFFKRPTSYFSLRMSYGF